MTILISGDFDSDEKKIFREMLRPYEAIFPDEVQSVSDIGDVKVALMTSWRELEPLMPYLRSLELLQCFFAGADRIDFSKLPPSLIVATASGAMASSVAEHAFALMLSLCRNILLQHKMMSEGRFMQLDPPNRELRGKRIGIVGYGSIGREVGRLSRAFEMEVWAVNSSGVSDADKTFTLGELDYVLSGSDIVVVAMPLNRHTAAMIDSRRLELMKSDATLINVSRGKVIVEGDLYRHLSENPKFMAGLDVWWRYPRKGERWSQDYPFENLPNVVMTPHNAATVANWRDRTIRFCCDNILRHLKDEKIKNKVKKEDYLI